MFEPQVNRADRRAVSAEYAWDLNSWDSCVADPLCLEALPSLGVSCSKRTPPDFIPGRERRPIMPPMGGARDVIEQLEQPRHMAVPTNDR
jgi:hypothetical protein